MSVDENAPQQIKWGDALAQSITTVATYIAIMHHEFPGWKHHEPLRQALVELDTIREKILNFEGSITKK